MSSLYRAVTRSRISVARVDSDNPVSLTLTIPIGDVDGPAFVSQSIFISPDEALELAALLTAAANAHNTPTYEPTKDV